MEPEWKAELDEVVKAMESSVLRYESLMPDTDDLTLMVLKGHLVIEEQLFLIAQQYCALPEHLEKVRLSFAQLSNLVRALTGSNILETTWSAISKLNGLRNALAHQLEPEDVSQAIDDLYRQSQAGSEPLEGYVRPTEPARIVEESVYALMGALDFAREIPPMIARVIADIQASPPEPSGST